MNAAGEILVHALNLPPDERADVALQLLHSLPDDENLPVEIDETLEMAIARRIEHYRAGQSKPVDLDTFKRTLREAARGHAEP